MIFNAYLGGSFDPVHFGHLTMLQTVNDRLFLALNRQQITEYTCQFVPTKANPFKQNQTATTHRLAMLKLAIANPFAIRLLRDDLIAQVLSVPSSPRALEHQTYKTSKNNILINEIEINDPADAPSYTADTLEKLHHLAPNDCHCWVMGLDSLIGLPTWKNYQKVNELAHIWVFFRQTKNSDLTTALDDLPDTLKSKITFNLNDLFTKKSGLIFIDKSPIPNISSTDIRTAFAHQNDDFSQIYVPNAVLQYAKEHHLYD